MNRVVFAFMLAWSAGAAEPVTVSPDQIVSNALAYSLRLKVLDKDVAAAGAKVDQARAQELPLFSADARASQYTGLEDMYLGPFFHLPAIETRSGVGVSVSQPLFTGGRLTSQKEGARQQQAAARHERQSASGDLALQALTAYWNWSKAVYAGEFLQAALARMEAHAVDMRNLHEAGLATDNDSLSTDVLLERTRLRFEEARRRVEVAQARIVFLTGQPLATNSLPEKTAAAVPPSRSEDLLLQAAQTNRPERAARQSDVQVAEAQVRVTRADYYPQVSLFARYEDARPNLNNIPPPGQVAGRCLRRRGALMEHLRLGAAQGARGRGQGAFRPGPTPARPDRRSDCPRGAGSAHQRAGRPPAAGGEPASLSQRPAQSRSRHRPVERRAEPPFGRPRRAVAIDRHRI